MSEGKEEEKRASKSRFTLSEEEREAVYRQLEERYGPDWRHKKDDALGDACWDSDLNRAIVLVGEGAKINHANDRRLVPLKAACAKGNLDIARLMVRRGADVNWRGKNDKSPLYLASENGHVAIVRLLLKRGANVYTCTNEGNTALYMAANYGRTEVVRVLLENDSDVDQARYDGRTPLFAACAGSHVGCIRVLMEFGASLTPLTRSHYTICHAACFARDPEVPRMMLELGVDLLQQNKDGDNSICVALTSKEKPVLAFLRSYTLEHGIFTHPHTDSVPNRNLFVTHKVESQAFLFFGLMHPLSKWEVSEYMDMTGCMRNGMLGLIHTHKVARIDDGRKRSGLRIRYLHLSKVRLSMEGQRTILFWLNY